MTPPQLKNKWPLLALIPVALFLVGGHLLVQPWVSGPEGHSPYA